MSNEIPRIDWPAYGQYKGTTQSFKTNDKFKEFLREQATNQHTTVGELLRKIVLEYFINLCCKEPRQ